jgi:phage terminase Nu1 subunit (DNA packaging protein)
MQADFDLMDDGSVRGARSSHGGARAGAGRKPADYVKPQEIQDFESARARNEAAKADLNELEYKIKSGEYVEREAVKQASATALATLAQALRSLPDTLERRLNVSPEITELIGAEIDACLESLSEDFALMTPENGI